MLAVLPSFHKVVVGTVPLGTDAADMTLCIEITRHHIHAAVELTAFKQFLALHEFNFSKPLTKELQLQAFDNLHRSQDVFKTPYGKVLVATDEFPTLLPKGFEMHTGNNHLQFSVSDEIISVVEKSSLTEKIASAFNQVSIQNIYNVFLKQVLNLPAGIYTLVSADSLIIAAIGQPGKLLLLNSFEYHTVDDFLYYLLLVCDELKTDREKIPLVLCGKIQQQSKIYDGCYRYFSNILFLKPDSGRRYSKALEEVSPHLHFTLFALPNF